MKLASELDRQGSSAAAIARARPPFLVKDRRGEYLLTILAALAGIGACNTHFSGMNAPHFTWILTTSLRICG